MDSDVVVVAAALLGALVGGTLTFLAQTGSDRARERARAREAAAMLRAEILRAQAALAMLMTAMKKKDMKRADLAGHALLSPPGVYFDTLGLTVASQMPVDWFVQVMSLYARWKAVTAITHRLEKDPKAITDLEREYVDDWLRDADVAQELLFLVSLRWWPRRWRYRELERELRKFMREDAVSASGESKAVGIDEYFRFVQFRRRK
jgi:hypothetical protein